jgi:hypothetical protein
MVVKEVLREIGDIDLTPKQVAMVFVWIAFILAVSYLLVSAGWSVPHDPSSTAAPTSDVAQVAAPSFELKVGDWHCNNEDGFPEIDGVVTNLTDHPIDNIVAVGGFYDGAGGFIKSDQAMIAYQPLMPGQTSPYKVITIGNPEIRRCTIAFKTFWGGTLSTER